MRIFLPYPPSANERLTFRKGGRGFVNSAKYRAWKEDAAWIVHMAVRGHGMILGPYRLDAVAMPPQLNRIRDLDNLLKATCDALKDGGAIEDDKLCQMIRISWGALDGSGILCEVLPCRRQLSLGDGSGKSPSEKELKSPRQTRRRSPRAAITPAAETGEFLDTALREALTASGRKLFSIPAGIIASKKPKT